MTRIVDFQTEKQKVIDSRSRKRVRMRQEKRKKRSAAMSQGMRTATRRSLRWSVKATVAFVLTTMRLMSRLVSAFIGFIVFGLLLGALVYYFVPDSPDWSGIMRMAIGIALCAGVYGAYMASIYGLSFAKTKLEISQGREAA